jgi:hypothetical protein
MRANGYGKAKIYLVETIVNCIFYKNMKVVNVGDNVGPCSQML